ncbi:MAG: TetR/AcrR family transcriptional regulator [Methylococcales bacterium]|jgi:TetR/AcrR family transcriptional regulator, transcriptional repressor for nem operon|nr:TetR/AcrR family transcriptional regulator [Methylococcales bacterium]MBT7409902.1 TetR/AcrR family transcriptional regulator [Methylococcales bacterium]
MERNPDQTRSKILQAAADEMHIKGFQGFRLDAVIAQTGVTKGALYHHFSNKLALGYAVVDEVVFEIVTENFLHPLELCDHPINCLKSIIEDLLQSFVNQKMDLGCPLNNLSQEMSPIDEGFRVRINHIYKIWAESIQDALKAGQKSGLVRQQLDLFSVSTFIVASLSGCVGLAKNARDVGVLECTLNELINYIETLRN